MAGPRRYDRTGIMTPLVSVVIPVYNAGQFLSDCLESVCAQTLQDIEIICVNDGSEDNSPEILKEFASRDSRIHIIDQPNGGELAARNSGIHAASGKWLGFVDSDDRAAPEMFERLVFNGEKYQTDISHCGLMFCYPDGHNVSHYGTGILRQQDHDTGLIDLLDGSQIEPSMCCKLYRRELFNGFDVSERIRHNGDLYCNFLLFDKASSAVYEDFCGYLYRQRPYSGLADAQSVERLRGILSVRHDILKMSEPPIHSAAYRFWLSTLVNTLNQVSVSGDPQKEAFYEECRALLRTEKDNISRLSWKQQTAALLHLHAPGLARLCYRVYGKYSIYRYEH